LALDPAEVGARRDLAPAHRDAAVERQQAGRRSGLDDRLQRQAVLLARPLVVGRPDPPVHAPAAVAGPLPAEQVLHLRPEVGRRGVDLEGHRSAVAGSCDPRRPLDDGCQDDAGGAFRRLTVWAWPASPPNTTPAASTASFTFITVSNLAWKVSSAASRRLMVMAETPAASASCCWFQPNSARAARIWRLEIMLDGQSNERYLLYQLWAIMHLP